MLDRACRNGDTGHALVSLPGQLLRISKFFYVYAAKECDKCCQLTPDKESDAPAPSYSESVLR